MTATNNLPLTQLADTVVVNSQGNTRRMSVADFAELVGNGGSGENSSLAAEVVARIAADNALRAELIAFAGKSFRSRAEAVAFGQENLPAALAQITTRESDLIVVRSPSATTDDPLFETAPQWGVVLRLPNDTLLASKADLANAGKMIGTRAGAVSMGQAGLPASLGRIITREGNYLVWRDNGANADDPLFDTAPYWGVSLRVPNDTLLAAKAALANAGRMFASRAAAVSYGQENIPASLGRIMTREGTVSEPKMIVRTPGSGTGPDPLFETSPYWSVDMTIDPVAYTRDSLIGFSSRTAAVSAGQASYPANAKVMVNLEGSDLVMRGWLHTADDPLFETGNRWGVIQRWPAGGSAGDMNAVRAYAEPRRSPRSSNLPIMTDGRSLWRWQAELARLKAGVVGAKPKVILAGDSWHGMDPIPVALRTRIGEDYPLAGLGWWPAVAGARFANAGAGMSRSGSWDSIDVTEVSSLPYGCGIDGNLLTTTGTDAAASIVNTQMTELRIYSRQWGGAWRYQVAGGAWTTAAEASDGSLNITTISGLSDGNHSVNIDTTPNGGRVALAGLYLTRDVAGVEVLRAGNGGSRGSHLSMMAPNIEAIAADLQPHLVITTLGTNDYRYNEGVASYISGLRAMRDAYRAAVPDCGFLFVSPALSNGTVVTPQSDFRDALYEMCIADGHEFYNWTDDWPSFAASNAVGLWGDALHPNDAGATAYVNRVYRHLLGL